MSKQIAITTEDNPYNPITQFDKWYAFDEQNGYHTCSYLDRVCHTSREMSDEDRFAAIEEAIDEMLRFNVTGKYKKVVEEV